MAHKFKLGDRVRCTRPPATGDWGFMQDATGVVFKYTDWNLVYLHWDDHADAERPPGAAPGYAWYEGGWEEGYFDLDSPLSPFDAAVRAYIKSEMRDA